MVARATGSAGGAIDMRMPVQLDLGGAVIDHIDFKPYGTIRICGWCLGERLPDCVVETVDGTLAPAATYRYAREDVRAVLGVEEPFAGLSFDFRVHGATVLSVEVE